MPGRDLELLIDAAEQAGAIAARWFDQGAQTWDKPDGAGPVTEADLAVNDMLHDRLRTARPDYGWLSEETDDDPARLACETLFVIDPIDGTRSFVDGARTWAHSLAIVRGGIPVAGAVFLPLRGLMYAAELGGGATLNGSALRVSTRAQIQGAQVLATKPNMAPRHWTGGQVPDLDRHHRPSLAYRLCSVAEGRFDAMLTLRPSWEWDIAAGALIAAEAGAQVTDRTGAPLTFNAAEPLLNGVIVAPPALHESLRSKLSHA